ncbi:MAG: hypothetical protein RJB68_2481 [Pseudomonadota bacterium]|jgi:hypothetical protein
MKRVEKAIPVSVLSAFAKARTGRATRIGESLLNHAAEALELSGIGRPSGASARSFVYSNREVIDGLRHKPVSDKERKQLRAEALAASETFLKSPEWARARMHAFVRYGNRCQCCGASPGGGVVLNVDHIKPRKTHPHLALNLTNLQVLCDTCNLGKGNWDATDWRDANS